MPQTLILRRHAQNQQDAHEVLRPGEEVRHEALLVLRRRHRDRPHARRFDGERAAVGVLGRHGFGEVQRFVDERAVHEEAGVVEARAQLRGHDVEVVLVPDGHGTLVEGEEGLVGPAAVGVGGGEVEHVTVGPLQWAGQQGAPGVELASEFVDDLDRGTAAVVGLFGFVGACVMIVSFEIDGVVSGTAYSDVTLD